MAALLALEGGLKAWAAANLTPGVDRPLVPGLLHLGFTLNPGMAWGLLGGLTSPLALLRLLVGLGIVAGLLSGRLPTGRVWPLALIAAGALGNALDGLTRGAVVDYLTAPVLDVVARPLTGRPFPIFNLSDVLVCTGTLWLLLHARRMERRAGHSASDRCATSQPKENS
ncbi:signal peptidase II (plasmid) [Deinococcus metallilatus]|uniref:Signal peptidase II n=1 Tax=Deinococcus metallilatus TaxID=1211322 RepID=A0AAJ5JZB2_9DEIO|nr:signal peptidase II [Deinococcus metallilatus]RXJ14908.1 signal peptidase II [Deinococcus metallilatus]TLK31029.1 signal peptidase II [Deinococcus metallilatus]